ncbi:MAG: YheT family hydrolase [Elainellaceae cyanobacterium]
MQYPSFNPPWYLRNGLMMTLFIALLGQRLGQHENLPPEPLYQPMILRGANHVPIFGWLAPPRSSATPRGTIIGTYGITGTLDNQWFLRLLGRKAFARGYGVLLFDWRAHGKTAELSPTLTSDGLYEGEDFVHMAAQAKAAGCPPPFWFIGFSLGGQLALWGVKASQAIAPSLELDISEADIGGGAVICPNLDSNRSLTYLMNAPLGRYLEKAIAKELKQLAQRLSDYHPNVFDAEAIARTTSIRGFDRELVIQRLGFSSVSEYYDASSPLPLLPHLKKPTLIIYAADDPMFDPAVITDLEAACRPNPAIDLVLTRYGGHVGYYSSQYGQAQATDPDPWWAWNRILDWCDRTVQTLI